MGGLHLEMLFLSVIGDLLDGSGWSAVINEAGITTEGRAESLIKATHVTRARLAHQLTACALDALQKEAFNKYTYESYNNEKPVMYVMDFDEWKKSQMKTSPMFFYWNKILEMELLLLQFVKSFRESDFKLYVSCLINIAPYVFIFDHVNYMRWLPVHIKDLLELPTKQPEVYENFLKGHFTAKKTTNPFSAISEDQSHEQNNARIKGSGGAIGITENEQALRRWMVSGPEISRLLEQYQQGTENLKKSESMKHHEESSSKQIKFKTNQGAKL